ncbi:MAG: N-acetyltransferase [Chloroflexi bacterium]|nr:N-acetyltransferase [Chloroflexota bacterium]
MKPMIRLATEADAEQIQAIYAPFVQQTAISFELEPPTVDEMRARISKTLVQFPWLVCVSERKILGYAYASSHRTRAAYQWAVDVSAYVAPSSQRAGIGKALYTVLMQIIRLQGFYIAYAGIALPNPASVGLHEALGFAPIGVFRAVGYKLGAWHDVGWWQCDLCSRAVEPALPVSLEQVIQLPEWTSILASGLP